MNTITKNIPNLITLGNLTCGLIAILISFTGDLNTASYFIFAGAILDFSDGLAARILKTNSELGKQLDSMADLITFGVAPGFILYHHIYHINHLHLFKDGIYKGFLFPEIFALLIPILSAYRLANFNIDIRQSTSFIGLPTPVSATLIAAIPFINNEEFPLFYNLNILATFAITISLLLVVKIPLISMKISENETINSKLNIMRIILIFAAAILFFIFGFAAIPFIVILYLILSILNNIL